MSSYFRFRVAGAPNYAWLVGLLGECTVCHHDDIRGGVLVEGVADVDRDVIRDALVDARCRDVFAKFVVGLDFYVESILYAGGCQLTIDVDAQCMRATFPLARTHRDADPEWWVNQARVADLNDVDMVHPQAMHINAILSAVTIAK